MNPEKLRQEIREEAERVARQKKVKTQFEALDIFLDTMINVIAKYLPDGPRG
jgi:hypothetical protein